MKCLTQKDQEYLNKLIREWIEDPANKEPNGVFLPPALIILPEDIAMDYLGYIDFGDFMDWYGNAINYIESVLARDM